MHLSRSTYAPAHDHIAQLRSMVDSSGYLVNERPVPKAKCCFVIDRFRLARPVIRAYASTHLSLVAITPNNIFHRLKHAEFLETHFVCGRRS